MRPLCVPGCTPLSVVPSGPRALQPLLDAHGAISSAAPRVERGVRGSERQPLPGEESEDDGEHHGPGQVR